MIEFDEEIMDDIELMEDLLQQAEWEAENDRIIHEGMKEMDEMNYMLLELSARCNEESEETEMTKVDK